MTDTPGKPFPTVHTQAPKPGPAWARIDPDGNVTATWRTWGVLAGAIIWATATYTEMRAATQQISAISIEVQAHREVLIKAGLLQIGATVHAGKSTP